MVSLTIPAKGSGDVNLLFETAGTISGIAGLLKQDAPSRDLKHWYTHVKSSSVLIKHQAERILSSNSRPEEPIVSYILNHLETIVTGHVLQQAPTLQIPGNHDRLRALNKIWRELPDQVGTVKVELLKDCVDFGSTPEKQDEFSETLENLSDQLDLHCPIQLSQTDVFAPPKRSGRDPPCVAWTAVQSLSKALILATKKCQCSPAHDFSARLSLGTYRKPCVADEDELNVDDDFEFDMLLNLQQQWEEVHIQTTKEKMVQWALNDTLKTHLKKKLNYKPMKIEKLCDVRQKLAGHRLEFKVEKGKLWKLRSEKSTLSIDMKRDPIPLHDFIVGGSEVLTEKLKRILAVLVSYAVLHLIETPWLQPTWGSSSILFFETGSSTIPLRPFVETELVEEIETNASMTEQQQSLNQVYDPDDTFDDFDPDDIDPDDFVPDPDDEVILHPFPGLVNLAILLMELYMAMPFEAIADKYQVEFRSGLQNSTKSVNADLVFQKCKAEIPEYFQFRHAIEKCLDFQTWQDERGKKLEGQDLRTKIYEEVVWPLEYELSKAFSDICIENLDKFAQTLNMRRRGETIQRISPDSHPDMPQHSSNEWDERSTESADTRDYHQFSKFHQHSHKRFQRHLEDRIQDRIQHHMQDRRDHLQRKIAGGAMFAHHPERFVPSFNDNKSFKFFDDEMSFESHSLEQQRKYAKWKQNFMKVYEKFIDDSLSKKPDTPRVKIAILDTGIDMDHQDVEARCEHIKGKYDWTSERPNRVIDQHGHGTHTANLVMDYAPDAELYVAKIARTKPADPRTIAKAINWAVKMKVDIISMSFGFPTKEIDGYSELEQTIQDAYSKGVLLFAAASNDGANKGVSYPARDRHVFGVYSTDANGNRSSFSPTARTNTVNFATIGEAVESAWPDYLVNDDDEDENAEDGARKHKSGTSFATPIAVGIAAFVLMYGRLNLKAEDIERLKRYAGMNAVLQKVAETSDGSRDRNGYFYLALNRYDDKLFGSEDEDYIKRTIVHTLHNS